MYPRRSSRSTKASKERPQRSPSPDEEVIHRRSRGKRQRTGLRKTKADDSVVDTDEGRVRDIIDVINSTHDAKYVAKEDEEKLLELADEDCYSITSSTAPGPSVLHNTTVKKLRPSQSMCSACWKLYQKAKKMKAPMKNKLLDNGEYNVMSVLGNWCSLFQQKTSMCCSPQLQSNLLKLNNFHCHTVYAHQWQEGGLLVVIQQGSLHSVHRCIVTRSTSLFGLLFRSQVPDM